MIALESSNVFITCDVERSIHVHVAVLQGKIESARDETSTQASKSWRPETTDLRLPVSTTHISMATP